jgi:hypothetical protein
MRMIHVNDTAQAQPPEAGVGCNDDVRVSINDQLLGAAAVASSAWFGKVSTKSQRISGQIYPRTA